MTKPTAVNGGTANVSEQHRIYLIEKSQQ